MRSISFRTGGLLLIFVIALHNLEEWLAFPRYPEVMSTAHQWIGLDPTTLSLPMLRLALILATVLPVILLIWAYLGTNSIAKIFVICLVAVVMVVNALVPHIPLAIAFGGYTPGILTAVLVNLPFCIWLLAKVRREDLLTRTQFSAAVFAGMVMLPVALLSILTVSKSVIA